MLDDILKTRNFILIIIILLAIILYVLFSSQKSESYSKPVHRKTVDLYYRPDCGHCHDFLPVWNKLEKTNLATFKSHNCDKGECTKDIYGVPTIKINGVVYNGNRTYELIVKALTH